METVLKFLPNVLKGRTKASFILHNVDNDDLEYFRKKNDEFVKNTLIVRKSKPKPLKKDEFFIKRKEWLKKRDRYVELTSGAFVVLDNVEDDESEHIERMELYKKFYPVIFISTLSPNGDDEEFLSAEIDGWKVKYFKNQHLAIYYNRAIKNFKTFIVNFQEIVREDSVKSLKTIEDEVFPYTTPRLEPDQTVKPVSIKKSGKRREANWEVFEGLPQPTMEPDHSSETWIKEFYLYLKNLISRIVPSKEERLVEFLVNKKTIPLWLDIFTSEYYNPNKGENYEAYEAVGDSVVKYVFYIYLYEKFGNTLGKDQLNDLKTRHLSKEWQGILGDKMELHKWLLVPEIIRDHIDIREDMTEAFTAGIEIILNRDTRRGMAEKVLLNMFHLLFKDYDWKLGEKMEKKGTPEVSKLIQWYPSIALSEGKSDRLIIKKPPFIDPKDWKKISKQFEHILHEEGYMVPIVESHKEEGVRIVETVDDDKIFTTKVYLSDKGYQILEEKGLDIKDYKKKPLAQVSGRVKVKNKAKLKAMEKLQELGVTDEWIARQKNKKYTAGLEGLEEVILKAKSQGLDIVKVDFFSKEFSNHRTVYQMYGVDENDKKVVLDTIETAEGEYVNFHQKLIENYLAS
jgi:hypothetical protein